MQKIHKFLLLAVSFLFLAGCATTKSGSMTSLEGRVQTLENKIQILESDFQSQSGTSASFEKSEKSVSADVMTKKQIQKALKNAGYYEGAMDGKMGPKTRAAIMEFQRNMGLKADGVAGRNTKEKLLKYLN